MKKSTTFVLTMMSMMVFAQTPRAFYNQVSSYPTADQLLSEQVRNQKDADYQQVLNQLEEASNQAIARVQAAMVATRNQAGVISGASAKQKQARQEMGNNMMQLIQEAGIPMEQLATMSEEEIEALLMPMLAKNAGFSQSEVEKLSKMSDREAEAYMRSHPDMMSRAQNSRIAQMAKEAGMEGTSETEEQDMERMNRIMEINIQVTENAQQLYFTSAQGETAVENFDKKVVQPYYDRIMAIQDECWQRVDKESPAYYYDELPAPAYVKTYYDRMNAIVKEANVAIAREWCKLQDQPLQAIGGEIEKLLPLYDEQLQLREAIIDATVRDHADVNMIEGRLLDAVREYVKTLKRRLEFPQLETYEAPKTYVPGGGIG